MGWGRALRVGHRMRNGLLVDPRELGLFRVVKKGLQGRPHHSLQLPEVGLFSQVTAIGQELKALQCTMRGSDGGYEKPPLRKRSEVLA